MIETMNFKCSNCGKIISTQDIFTSSPRFNKKKMGKCSSGHPYHDLRVITEDYDEYSDYQKQVADCIKAMSNGDLLEQVIESSAGDSYDGCFTVIGEFQFKLMYRELKSRLANWISEDE